jgi:CHAD domain-containing protein
MTARSTARRLPTEPARASSRRTAVGDRALVGYLTEQVDALRANRDGAASADVDAVHDMRVATRRLRSALRTFRPVLRRWQPVRDELKWLANALGEVRDGDVMSARLAAELDAQPPELVVGPVRNRLRLAGDLAKARRALAAALDSPRYRRLLVTLDDLVATGPSRRLGRARLRRAVRRDLRRADERLTNARGDDELHEARKAYKRARYAVEVLRPVDGKPANRLRTRLGELQDVLGDHQDAVVTAALLRRQAMRAFAGGENTFTYGLLTARQQQSAATSRALVEAAHKRATAAAEWL